MDRTMTKAIQWQSRAAKHRDVSATLAQVTISKDIPEAMGGLEAHVRGRRRGGVPRAYLLISLLLLCYVAVLTGNRSERLDADAWEHHRAVLALEHQLWRPGNPTYDTHEPSIRYSPYSVALALIVRCTSIDAYDALSGAAVVNTLLLLLALWWWLRGYGLDPAAPLVLLTIIFLYGQPPGYANSNALSDLPWHQVNPSAFALPMMIFIWAWLSRVRGRGLIGFALCASILLAFAVLSHGMTGVLGAFGLFVTAAGGKEDRWPRLIVSVVVCGLAFVIAMAWPWYDFLLAVGHCPDKWYWFNPAIFKRMLLVWCLPAILASAAALPMRDDPFIRTALLATVSLIAIAFGGAALGSPTLARLPLAGLIFPQVAVGVFLYRVRVMDPGSWPTRINQLWDRDRATMSKATIETLIAGLVVAMALPNLWLVLREPHLARRWVSPLMGREDKQPNNWEHYDTLLSGHIKTGDVVLAEPLTGWPVPSFGGRVVGALHLEFFTPNQRERLDDTRRFFAPHTTPTDRAALIEQYNVSWLLLDRDNLSPAVFAELFRPGAVVSDDGRRVLMDAHRWVGLATPGGSLPGP